MPSPRYVGEGAGTTGRREAEVGERSWRSARLLLLETKALNIYQKEHWRPLGHVPFTVDGTICGRETSGCRPTLEAVAEVLDELAAG